MHGKSNEKVYVKPGDTVVVQLGWSQHACDMGLADRLMPVRILDRDGYGQLLSIASGLGFGLPNPLGWLSFHQDAGRWYSHDIYERCIVYSALVIPGRFYVYVGGEPRLDLSSLRFEEVRDVARSMQGSGFPDAEVRFVERSRFLPSWWTTSTTVPLDSTVREEFTGSFRFAFIDLPNRPGLFAGRQDLQEG
ncbi:hypothetical protein [Streptomyces noursei]|uniref:Uncharacterized protein n=1 Tax=Streptomyces noursei TaxID=1971 RepID=A0A2N8PQR5_STRNR|nr:hypothetical protein [Streptomyces noursei]PNE43372.1 hypothetical protein AOB60_00030 [Streptomyces noursei]